MLTGELAHPKDGVGRRHKDDDGLHKLVSLGVARPAFCKDLLEVEAIDFNFNNAVRPKPKAERLVNCEDLQVRGAVAV